MLGRIPGFTEALFPPESVRTMSVLANFGLVLFMFVIGLELDTNYIKTKGKVRYLIFLYCHLALARHFCQYLLL